MLLIVTGGQFVRFVVKVIWEDFVWFKESHMPNIDNIPATCKIMALG
jgi:hypothetical protein